jgi:PAS domain S-box-containing protein
VCAGWQVGDPSTAALLRRFSNVRPDRFAKRQFRARVMRRHNHNADETKSKAGIRRRNRWLRKIQANGIKVRRRGVSLRTLLIALLGVLVLAATASLGSIAYRTSRKIVEKAAVREVGTIATLRKQALIRVLTQQRARATALLKTADVACSPDETWCLRKLMADFVSTEGAASARLTYRGRTPLVVGERLPALATRAAPEANQIARFEFDKRGEPTYVLQVTTANAVLMIRGDMEVADQVFLDRYGLGQSGETFLTDNRGFFLTPAKNPTRAGSAVTGEPMQMCLAGMDGELLGPSYRGVPVVHAFRHVPEIGGGCIMALLDESEAFAPARGIAREVAGVSGLLAGLAITCSFLFAEIVSRPMRRLTSRARSLQKGDFDSPVPVGGPSEVRMFAETFEAMALSLKSSRSALQHAAERLQNILESISEGFAAFDRQWRCTYVNEKALELGSVPRDELLGKNVWDLFEDSAGTTAYAELNRSMEQRVPVHFEAHYMPLEIWLEVDAYPTRDGLAVFGRDVTERKHFNERLQQTQKLESLGVLAGGIAHDFNNLLTGIMGNASLVLEELPADSPARSGLEAVVTAGERAAELTRQLLAYAGKGRFVIEPVSLSELVRQISNLVRASIPKTVQLHLKLRDDLPPIEADAAQIQQLVMNLVINAAESISEDKTGRVLITTNFEQIDQAYIDQTIASDTIVPGRYVTLEVRDRGCGMDAETVSRIFEPFFTTKFTGRGLGLAAVMGIVRGHKAALKVESVPGEGSTFKVLFPASQGKPARIQQPEVGKKLAGTGTILVIDDEEAVRQTAKAALESYGYTVAAAENGKEGIEMFRILKSEISAILLDMTMPVMSGEEALLHLKTIRPDVAVVLSSGYDEAEATRRFTGKGLAGFIQKPYTAARLAEIVNLAIQQGRRQMRRHHHRRSVPHPQAPGTAPQGSK